MENHIHKNRLYAVLAYAGTLPFIACALLPAVGAPEIAALGGYADIAAGYGVAIASFMAGIHWGTWLYRKADGPLNLLLTSNAITVAVWLGFVTAPAAASLMITGLAFLLLLLVDYRLARQNIIATDYLALRRNVTGIVIAMLLIAVVST